MCFFREDMPTKLKRDWSGDKKQVINEQIDAFIPAGIAEPLPTDL
jgi:hypothetical protein